MFDTRDVEDNLEEGGAIQGGTTSEKAGWVVCDK